MPDKETVNVAVMVLLSDKPAVVTFVLLRLANVEHPRVTSFEGVWSKFTTRSGGIIYFSTALAMSYKYGYSVFFLAPSGI